jgi:hypothetical protein
MRQSFDFILKILQECRIETLEALVSKRIDRKRGDVFLRADFADLGGHDQVGRVLLQFVRQGKLLKIGSGLYTRTQPSTLDGAPTPVKGLRALADEAVRRLGVQTAPTHLERSYSAGTSMQIPAGRHIAVAKRIRREIGYNGVTISFEPARPRDVHMLDLGHEAI